MALNSASELGRIIGGLVNTTNQIQSDHVPGDVDQSLVLTPIDAMKLETTVTIIQKFYSSTAFILDHPVYGELDSSVLELDGDYDYNTGEQGDVFPLTFPIDFSESQAGGMTSTLHDIYTG